MNIRIFLDEIINQDKDNFKFIDKTINLLKDPKDELAFAIEFNNLSKLYENTLIQTKTKRKITSSFDLNTFTNLELARIYLIVKIANKFEKEHVDIIENLFKTADTNELIALCKSLPFLPEPEKFLFRANESVRSNNTLIFNSIALNNTYPMNFFDENSWNQLILKAFFIESDIKQVIGIQKRINSNLICMLIDFANERYKAGRTVNPELFDLVNMYKDKS